MTLPPQGATLANLLLSGVGQVLTAVLTRCVLRKRLTNGQLGGILFVFLGLAVRAAPPAYFGGAAAGSGSDVAAAAAAAAGAAPKPPAAALQGEQLVGAALVALAALLYSLLVSFAGRRGCCMEPLWPASAASAALVAGQRMHRWALHLLACAWRGLLAAQRRLPFCCFPHTPREWRMRSCSRATCRRRPTAKSSGACRSWVRPWCYCCCIPLFMQRVGQPALPALQARAR